MELVVHSTPPGALITTSTERVLGRAPLITTVPRGEEVTIYFKLDGMASDWRRIKPSGSTTLNVKLQPLPK